MVLRNSSIALLFLTLGLPVFAQSDATTQDSPAADRPVYHRARVQTPCWKQAGMTPDMVNRRWHIEDEQKVKIARVCTEPSTSAQQKHDKIDQIHADTDHAIAQLIPTQELKAFNKCQAEAGSTSSENRGAERARSMWRHDPSFGGRRRNASTRASSHQRSDQPIDRTQRFPGTGSEVAGPVAAIATSFKWPLPRKLSRLTRRTTRFISKRRLPSPRESQRLTDATQACISVVRKPPGKAILAI